ncbi:MAG: hypothetical protein K9G48_14695 [Reyranella sp.]|nr:hypothetical protein [Reyranella sp.]
MRRSISVLGLRHVGLPVATTFGRTGFQVVSFDIDATRILELPAGHDRTREVEDDVLYAPRIRFTSSPDDWRPTAFHTSFSPGAGSTTAWGSTSPTGGTLHHAKRRQRTISGDGVRRQLRGERSEYA